MGVDLVRARVGRVWLEGTWGPQHVAQILALPFGAGVTHNDAGDWRCVWVSASPVILRVYYPGSGLVQAHAGARSGRDRLTRLLYVLQTLGGLGLRWDELQFDADNGVTYTITAYLGTGSPVLQERPTSVTE